MRAAEEGPAGPGAGDAGDEAYMTVSFLMPRRLHRSVKVRAAQEGTTVRGMVMRALRAHGFEVPDDELVDRRPGRAGRRRSGDRPDGPPPPATGEG